MDIKILKCHNITVIFSNGADYNLDNVLKIQREENLLKFDLQTVEGFSGQVNTVVVNMDNVLYYSVQEVYE